MLCAAQHTWDDDSPKKRERDRKVQAVLARNKSARGESVIPLKALEIPLHDNRSQHIHLMERETFCSVYVSYRVLKYFYTVFRSCVQRSNWRSLETQKTFRCLLQPFAQMGASSLIRNAAPTLNLERRSVVLLFFCIYIATVIQAGAV